MLQRYLKTVATNPSGRQQPLYLAGNRMLEAVPFFPLAGQVRIAVAIFSYDGALKFGVTGDYVQAPDIRVLVEGIEEGMAELVSAAGRSSSRSGTEKREQPEGAPDGVATGANS